MACSDFTETCVTLGIIGGFMGFFTCIWVSKLCMDCFCYESQTTTDGQRDVEPSQNEDPVRVIIELQKPHIIFIKNPMQPCFDEDPV